MNYLGRPIFSFAINWAMTAPARDITYDLRETLLGFGAEYFVPTQTYTSHAWDFEVLLRNGADFLAWENFCDALIGRRNGFWLPCPLQPVGSFIAGLDASNFQIVAEGLADTWNSRPDQHLLFTFADGTQAAARISGVVNNGDGTETVTLATALAQTPNANTLIKRLHYVRFGTDTEQYEFIAENIGSIQVTVVELPLEYTNAQTGLQPIWLYHFFAKAPVAFDWRYTSFAAPVVSAGKLFSNFPMSHKQLKQTLDGQSQPLEIEAKYDATHPLAMLAGVPPGRPLQVEIFLCYYATPDQATKVFSGFVSEVTDDGAKLTAKCNTRLAWLTSKAPKFLLGSTCNWNLYDKNCGALRAVFETTVSLASIVGGNVPIIKVTFNFTFGTLDASWKTDDWFTGGTLETGFGTQYQLRSIIHSHWNGAQLELTLNEALNFVLKSGTQFQITAGCDHTFAGVNGCKNKFNNFANFGGFVAIPQQNLSLQAINNSTAAGGKK